MLKNARDQGPRRNNQGLFFHCSLWFVKFLHTPVKFNSSSTSGVYFTQHQVWLKQKPYLPRFRTKSHRTSPPKKRSYLVDLFDSTFRFHKLRSWSFASDKNGSQNVGFFFSACWRRFSNFYLVKWVGLDFQIPKLRRSHLDPQKIHPKTVVRRYDWKTARVSMEVSNYG